MWLVDVIWKYKIERDGRLAWPPGGLKYMASVLDRVRDIAADKLSVDAKDVSPESSFTEDLNADSLDVVELIMAIEEEFGSDVEEVDLLVSQAVQIKSARVM